MYYVYLEKLGEELEAITVLDWAWNTINENWHEKCLQLLNLLYTRVYNSVQMFEPIPDQNSISLKKSVGADFSFKSFENRYVQSLYDQITQEDSSRIAQVIFEAMSLTKIFDYGGQNGSLVITPQNIFQPPIGGVRGVRGTSNQPP